MLIKSDDHKAHDAGRSLVYDVKGCNAVVPKALPKGPCEAGIGHGGCQDRDYYMMLGRLNPATRRIFRWRLLRPSRSRPEAQGEGLAKRGSAMASGDVAAAFMDRLGRASRYGIASAFGRYCSALRGRDQSAGRGAPRSGIDPRIGMRRSHLWMTRAVHPAAGSHLPSEATAPPFAFASSPFAHPLPQSRRRARVGFKCGIYSEIPKILRPSIPHHILVSSATSATLPTESGGRAHE